MPVQLTLRPAKGLWVQAVCLWICSLFLISGVHGAVHEAYFKKAMEQQDAALAEAYGRKACLSAMGALEFKTASYYYLCLGKSFFDRGEYLRGIAQARAGLSVSEKFRLHNDTLAFHHNALLAALYGHLPLGDSAVFWFTQCNNLLLRKPVIADQIPEDVCAHYLSQGKFYGWTGDFHRSQKYLTEGLLLARKIADPRYEALCYNYLGNSSFNARDFQKADFYYHKALAGYRPGSADKAWGEVILGNNLRALARPLDGIARIAAGRKQYNQLIKRDPLQRDVDFEIQSSSYLAECEVAAGKPEAAQRSYRACIALHRQSGRVQGEFIAFSWIGLGRIALRAGQLDSALYFAGRAVAASSYPSGKTSRDAFPVVVSEKTLYHSLFIAAETRKERWRRSGSLEELEKAVLAYDETLDAAARLRRNMIPEESKHFHVEQVARCSNSAVELCYELYSRTRSVRWKNLFFDLVERNRSMVMADLLHEKYRVGREVPAKVIARERALKQRKSTLGKLLATASGSFSRDSLLAAMNKLNVESYNFLDSLENAFGRYYALKYDFKELSLPDVARRLDDVTAYLSYFVSEQNLYCVTIGKYRSEVRKMLLPRDFRQLIARLRQSLDADPVMFDFNGHAHAARLYQLLVKPFLPAETKFERLVIARDGPLHYIPYEALELEAAEQQFLGGAYAVSYAYSARLFFEGRREAMTAPVVSGFAPYSGEGIPDSMKLISSQAEVRAWEGVAFLGKAATKARFKTMADSSDVMLLATHAVANPDQPEHSSIAFYPNEPDSLLYAIEIANMPLDKLRLVILSACEGNAGSLNKAEGLLSLARAFRLAGCRTILTTSWKAQSESISEFSQLFRAYLAKGQPADIALQQTRRQFMTDPRLSKWAHPYYWANFTLIGNPAAIYPAAPRYHQEYYAVLALTLSAGVFIAARRSRAAGQL